MTTTYLCQADDGLVEALQWTGDNRAEIRGLVDAGYGVAAMEPSRPTLTRGHP